MNRSEELATTYDFSLPQAMVLSLTGTLLEAAQTIHVHLPEPFDLANHGGNMGIGAAIAVGAAVTYAAFNSRNERLSITEASMRRFRRVGVVAICGAVALANCVTETQWGVDHLPIASWLGGTTPDVLDTIYSTAWAGITSLAVWRRDKGAG